ncbi:ecotropic viral integration site 5 ortholog [Girardinichthys multiradiatus]|uniref:ecotropic viral integration site 5 ortholog n=1 Tax=Girardinichthys multiradiatus TaxID=208333 RepID=UPI001FABE965|nr:ecotropic viral integration site 5 ortholog [Girardinichthys multiradiatus]
MLKQSSQAQKHLSKEDNSGSDAGSEVSLEPETDRFGFILTNGSTAGSVGPSPEVVRQREAKWINIMSQWDFILSKKSSKVKLQCQKGIPASLRAKCWPLLCGATDRMAQNKKLYEFLDSQPGLQSWVDIIERDLDRQFPFHEMFLSKDGHGQRGLFRVLKAYTQFQPEEGYCQAQGPVAAVLLMNMPAEEAFWCLVQISEQYLPGYYSPLLEGVLFDAAILSWVLKKMCPAIHKHLQQHGVEPLMFATDWLMCLFTRHLPFNTLLRVWDLFFCYGVKVLLQVAVVLVRCVLGRAEQRKQCAGQMETLERLRGVREHVQEEEESFIAEVCAVPLSGKDLKRRMEKELQRWRTDKPSSTFDPRGRCYGYRMACLRVRQWEEERERKEREKGNLSVPLARSASTLSLSPSLLHKKFRRGKVNAGESGNKVARHLSIEAKEDWKSWSDLDFKKIQGVQEEDVVSDGHKTETETKLEEENEQEENKNSPTDHKENTVRVEEQHEPLEAGISEKDESKEMGESKIVLEKTGQFQSVENNSQTAEDSSQCEEKEKPNQPEVLEEENHKSNEEESGAAEINGTENRKDLQNMGQSHVLEEQSNKNEEESGDTQINKETENSEKLEHLGQSHVLEEQSNEEESEATDMHEEAENPAAENKNKTTVEKNHTEIQRENTDTNTEVQIHIHTESWEEPTTQAGMKPEASTETENSQPLQMDAANKVSETRSETNQDSESHRDLDPKTDTQEGQEEVITETQEKCYSNESFIEKEKAESHTQTETETDVLAENAAVQDDLNIKLIQTEPEELTEEQSQIPSAPESTYQQEEMEIKTMAVGGTAQEIEDIMPKHLDTQSEECVSDQINSEESQKNNQTYEEAAECASSAEKEEILTQDESVKSDKIQISTSDIQAPEQSASGTVEDAESTENVPESKAGEENVLISPGPTSEPNSDSYKDIQEKINQDAKDLAELSDSSQKQTSVRRSSRSSGDFCLRKSSSSRGSKLTRRLSEDLFSYPEKTNQSHFSPSQPESEPKEVKSEQSVSEVADDAAVPQQEQQPDTSKRFRLFRKLKGEQPKKAKPNKKPKMQVPKILIQDFSDMTPADEPVQDDPEEKLSSRERRRRRREEERKEKEEEKLKKKKEKEQERERRKPQTRGKSFQAQREKVSDGVAQSAKTGSQILRHSDSYAECYF